MDVVQLAVFGHLEANACTGYKCNRIGFFNNENHLCDKCVKKIDKNKGFIVLPTFDKLYNEYVLDKSD
tara:strand:- start:2315 stop:2518 length:204 start_codon:yes stop_codon:yes gene_type:complete